jgi:hypothetical protein
MEATDCATYLPSRGDARGEETLEQQRLELRAREVDGRGVRGWSAADNDDLLDGVRGSHDCVC